jgi:hypothetical protein
MSPQRRNANHRGPRRKRAESFARYEVEDDATAREVIRVRPPSRPRDPRTLLLFALLILAAMPVAAQWRRFVAEPNVPYDGRFTFARIRYTVHGRSGWEFDYPEMERNLMTAMRELTTLRPHERGSNIHALDDPELLRYPVAYLSEPGYWIPDSAEVAGLRTYLAKGGFLIVDDFMRGEWVNFEHQMLKVLPGARFVRLQPGDQVLDTFFHVDSLKMPYPHNPYLEAEFFGIHEDNDPARRLMVVINYNNDIGDYMEWSRTSWLPVNPTNDAYKLAVNYLVYGMTH